MKKKASCGTFSIKRWDALPKSNMHACPLNRKSTYHSLIKWGYGQVQEMEKCSGSKVSEDEYQ